jgi:hypothetical protein
MTTLPHGATYIALKSPINSSDYPPSPPLSRHSSDSDDSEALRALELSEGPLGANSQQPGRGRSYSIGFDFQRDLLPLSASLSEPDNSCSEAGEKSISLLNGAHSFEIIIIIRTIYERDTRRCAYCRPTGGSYCCSRM